MVRLIWDNEQEFIDITDDLIKTLTACMEQTLAFETFDKDAEVSLTFTDNSGIKERNRIARGIDKPTDVLSFPMLDYEADGTLEICDEDLSEGAVVLFSPFCFAQAANERTITAASAIAIIFFII